MKTIKHCINSRLLDLCSRAMKLETLNLRIKNFLPEELQPVCQVGSFENGCLTLITPDAVWATSLNFLKSELRDFLRKEGGLTQLASISIKILPLTIQTACPVKTGKKLPLSVQKILLEEAENYPESALKQALIKLAR